MEVVAAEPWNDTLIDVVAGEPVVFAASGTWSDASFRCGPEGYRPPVWLRIATPLLRCRQGGWFELCGAIGRDRRHLFPVGRRQRITMSATGRLYLFANDVPGFYRLNNRGGLAVAITRVANQSDAGDPRNL